MFGDDATAAFKQLDEAERRVAPNAIPTEVTGETGTPEVRECGPYARPRRRTK